METLFWCKLFQILWIGVTCALAINETALRELAVISKSYDVRTLTTENVAPVTTESTAYWQSEWQDQNEKGSESGRMAHDHDEYQDGEVLTDDHYHHHEDEMVNAKAVVGLKNDYWGGYYDFLINEGSYKFWAIFQLGTAALLIYSGFAALYYAKVNPINDDDYEDFFARRRKRSLDRDKPPRERGFFGLDVQTLQRILDAVAREIH